MASGQTPVQAEISISIDRVCKGITPAARGTVQTLRGDDPRLGAMDYGWGPAAKELDRLTRYTGGLPDGPSRAHILHTDTGRLLHYSVCGIRNCGELSVSYIYTLGKINHVFALYFDEGRIRYLGHPTLRQRRLLLSAACMKY